METVRHIRLRVVYVENTVMGFKVLEQTHRGTDFCPNGIGLNDRFTTSVVLASRTKPEFMNDKFIYLLGTDTARDGDFIIIKDIKVLDDIVGTVQEYNDYWLTRAEKGIEVKQPRYECYEVQ